MTAGLTSAENHPPSHPSLSLRKGDKDLGGHKQKVMRVLLTCTF